jgi:hypothetical protein
MWKKNLASGLESAENESIAFWGSKFVDEHLCNQSEFNPGRDVSAARRATGTLCVVLVAPWPSNNNSDKRYSWNEN